MYRSSSSVFMMNNTPSGTKKYHKNANHKVARQPKGFSFFFFRQASSKLCDSFTIVFAQNSSKDSLKLHQPLFGLF